MMRIFFISLMLIFNISCEKQTEVKEAASNQNINTDFEDNDDGGGNPNPPVNPGPPEVDPPIVDPPIFVDEADELFFNITINGEEQNLLNEKDIVGCQRQYGSFLTVVNVFGSDGEFLGKNGEFEFNLTLSQSLVSDQVDIVSHGNNPKGMGTLGFTSDDAPFEQITLPIGVFLIPKRTHYLTNMNQGLPGSMDQETSVCEIKAHARGSILDDFGLSPNGYGIRNHYREFTITCTNYQVKDEINDQYLAETLDEFKVHFNCEETVYY